MDSLTPHHLGCPFVTETSSLSYPFYSLLNNFCLIIYFLHWTHYFILIYLHSLFSMPQHSVSLSHIHFYISTMCSWLISPITFWQIDGETMETVADFIFLGSKITADGECRHEIKRHLLLGRKVMTILDSVLKSRDITFLTKVLIVKAMVFPVVMYGCKRWTTKKAERRRIMPSNCDAREDSWESLGLQGDPTSPS